MTAIAAAAAAAAAATAASPHSATISFLHLSIGFVASARHHGEGALVGVSGEGESLQDAEPHRGRPKHRFFLLFFSSSSASCTHLPRRG
jgi:hypothetical protein